MLVPRASALPTLQAAPAPAHLAGKGIRIIGAELPVAPFAGSARITAPAEGATCSAVLVFRCEPEP